MSLRFSTQIVTCNPSLEQNQEWMPPHSEMTFTLVVEGYVHRHSMGLSNNLACSAFAPVSFSERSWWYVLQWDYFCVFRPNSVQSMNVMNLLWAFNFKATDLDKRDSRVPVTYKDFVPVSCACMVWKYILMIRTLYLGTCHRTNSVCVRHKTAQSCDRENNPSWICPVAANLQPVWAWSFRRRERVRRQLVNDRGFYISIGYVTGVFHKIRVVVR